MMMLRVTSILLQMDEPVDKTVEETVEGVEEMIEEIIEDAKAAHRRAVACWVKMFNKVADCSNDDVVTADIFFWLCRFRGLPALIKSIDG